MKNQRVGMMPGWTRIAKWMLALVVFTLAAMAIQVC
jgi:hypothetical protein